MRPLPTTLLALTALIAPCHAYEPEIKPPRLALLDGEIRANLQGEETRQWESLERRQKEADLDIIRGNELLTPRRAALKGFESESPEARKARGDALVKTAKDNLARIDKERAQLLRDIESRLVATAAPVRCPLLSLKDAFNQAATELTEAGRNAGYTRIIPAGVVLPARGGSARDNAMSSLLVETLQHLDDANNPETKSDANHPTGEPSSAPAPAPIPPAEPTAGPQQTAWILGEIRPCEAPKGALVAFRLVDKSTGLVQRATLALVPAAPNEITRRAYGATEPPAYRAMILDTRNFLTKLGASAKWTFEVEGDDAAACVARVTIAARGAPALSDATTLRRLLDKKIESPAEVKAYWTTSTDPETKTWFLNTRLAAKNAKTLPVGRIDFAPAPVEKK